MVMEVPTLAELFDERHYRDLGGGMLEAFGRLLSGPVRLFIYPWRNSRAGELVTAETFRVRTHLGHLYDYMLENRFIEAIREYSAADLSIMPRDVLARLQAGDSSWETMVPAAVVRVIKEQRLFGLPETSQR
jgi:hypothetical protein